MGTNKVFRVLLLFAVLTAGVWLLGRPGGLQPEGLARMQALSGLARDGAQGTVPDIVRHAPVSPVSVDLADVPERVGDGNSQYERWLRGELDLDENDNIISVEEMAALKALALDLPAATGLRQMRSGPELSSPTPGTGFEALSYLDCCGGGGSVPPDPELAAGPDHLIAVVNVAFEIYNKSGTSLEGPTTFSSFFASLGGTNCTAGGPFDPNVLYDEEADRFFMAVDGDGNAYCVAVTQTSDPTGSWYLYEFATNVGGNFFDYPHAGVGRDAIYMGANMFAGNFYDESRIWAFDKSDLYSGAAVSPVSRSLGDDDTPQPINLHGFDQGTWPSSGPHYFLTDRDFNGATYALHAWTDPFGANTFTTLEVFNLPAVHGVTVGLPVDVQQSGGGSIQGNDFRPLDFEYRNGSGWSAMTVSCNPGGGTVNCVQWAEIDLDDETLVQTGVIASDDDYRTFPDTAANECGDAVVGYTKSNTTIFPSVWATGRQSGDALGTMQAEVELKAGEINYTAFDTQPRRWGDYTGMTIDPDGQTFWYLGQYSENTGTTSGRWGTYIAALSFGPCGSPTTDPTIHVDPADLQGTQAADTVVTHTLTISNSGTTALTWTIDEALPLQPARGGSPERIVPDALPAPETLARDFDLAPLADVITDGGFEDGSPNAAWNEASTNFGTPLCNAGCGTGGGTGAHSGSWWAWFGGISVAETGSVDQDVVIPSGTATLSFWLEIPAAGTTGSLTVDIDGNVLATYTEADAATYATYQQVTLDVSAYADGAMHNVAFESSTDAGADVLNFFVDDVVLDAGGVPAGCDAPSDIPWASVSPASGTTAYNTTDDVDVVFDATGLATGVYTGTLCVDSNDPATPRVEVPLEMTVTDAPEPDYDVYLPVILRP